MNYYNKAGYYSSTFLLVYYDGYGYNFYYDDYGYYEYSVNEQKNEGGAAGSVIFIILCCCCCTFVIYKILVRNKCIKDKPCCGDDDGDESEYEMEE